MARGNSSALGGTGACYRVLLMLKKGTKLTLTIGKGGISYGAPKNNYPIYQNADSSKIQVTDGEASKIVFSDGKSIIAGGGSHAEVGDNWYRPSPGGKLQIVGVTDIIWEIIKGPVVINSEYYGYTTDGDNGHSAHVENTKFPYPNYSYGAPTWVRASDFGSLTGPVHHGYILIKKLNSF